MKLIKFAPLVFALALAGVGTASAAEDAQKEHGGWFERMCAKSDDASRKDERAQHRADRLAEKLKLTDAQKAAFKDLADTRAKLRADHKAALCAAKPDLSTFDKKLAFRQSRLEAKLADLKVVTPKLLAFYNSLDEHQKAAFSERGGRGHHGRGDNEDRDHHWRHSDD